MQAKKPCSTRHEIEARLEANTIENMDLDDDNDVEHDRLNITDVTTTSQTTEQNDENHDSSQSNNEKRKLVTYKGEIGNMKCDVFCAMTNFAVKCKGYVTEDINQKSPEGFLIEVIAKDSVPAPLQETEFDETQENESESENG
jgi:acetyl-CoA carboxylase beta subunit